MLIAVMSAGFCTGYARSNDNEMPGQRFSLVRSPLVVSFHKLAEQAGYRIFKSGGNAFDTYVAVTMVENVVSSGYVTLAGLLSTLVFQATTNEVIYLDAGYNSVLNPQGAWDKNNPALGKKIVVPGIVAGLEAISRRYGKLSFSRLLKPAIELARDGFVVDERYVEQLASEAKKLQGTAYGRSTFFRNGRMLKPGDILKQPRLAEFLVKLAKHGARYMYRGEWADLVVKTVRDRGGYMTKEDLAAYRPTWTAPWKMSYRGYDIYASSGRSIYALWSLLALKTLENTTFKPIGHFSFSADALEILVRVARAVDKEYWIRDYKCLDNRDLVHSRLSRQYCSGIWAKVKKLQKKAPEKIPPSYHTLASVIADTEGNVVCGKHSINSDLWGDGLFVQGVLLNGSGDMTGRYTGPGQRRTQGAGNFFVFKKGALKYALGTFSFSNPHAAFQFLVNIMDYGLPADKAVDLPRFGSYPFDLKDWSVDVTKNWLDRRVSQDIVNKLKSRGLFFSQENTKLGKGCIVEFHGDGTTSSGYDREN